MSTARTRWPGRLRRPARLPELVKRGGDARHASEEEAHIQAPVCVRNRMISDGRLLPCAIIQPQRTSPATHNTHGRRDVRRERFASSGICADAWRHLAPLPASPVARRSWRAPVCRKRSNCRSNNYAILRWEKCRRDDRRHTMLLRCHWFRLRQFLELQLAACRRPYPPRWFRPRGTRLRAAAAPADPESAAGSSAASAARRRPDRSRRP